MRKVIEDSGNLIHDSTILGSDMQKFGTELFRTKMEEKLGKSPALLAAILPTFAPGCRRLTPGPGFLESLTEENVEVTFDRISKGLENGLQLETGRVLDLDAIICATGFKVDQAPTFEVLGRNGQTLAQRWSKFPESYLSIAVDGFPNYLMILGPNSNIGFGSLTMMVEAETDYVVKAIRKVQKENYATIEVKAQRVAEFTQFVSSYFENTVYVDNCKSWYRSEGGRGSHIFGIWPGSTLHALETLRSPRWEDFDYTSTDKLGSALSWLGNGWSITQTRGDPSWYINPDEIDFPNEGRPEENKRYISRPWSY
jgi:hypothetical protein